MPSPILEIELTSFCNANCRMCPRSIIPKPFGKMDPETFSLIMGKSRDYGFKTINFSGRGEPLLHPQIVDFVKIIRNQNKTIKIFLITNGALLSEKMISDLIEAGVNDFSVSFSGYDKESYEKVMCNLDFEVVVQNLKNLVKAVRARKNLSIFIFPTVSKIFPVESFEKTVKLLHSLGLKPEETPGFSICNSRAGSLASPDLVDNEFYASLGKTILPVEQIVCVVPFRYQLIMWNGDIELCCADFKGEAVLGNIRTHSFQEIDEIKKSLLKGPLLSPICTNCTMPFALGEGKGYILRK
ncbi:MAG: radical SAM/SPASM domain-containing protein [Candidatus Saganbacteria bacterium]|nr:radical SAM/SPASM domain-containing protein [Candidatus Saganbacteria bacterium]